jgi:hypothetical protein
MIDENEDAVKEEFDSFTIDIPQFNGEPSDEELARLMGMRINDENARSFE